VIGKNQSSDITLTEEEPLVECFDMFLNYIYNNSITLTIFNSFQLYALADKYAIEILRAEVIKFIKSLKLDPKQANMLYDICDFFDIVELKDFLCSHSCASVFLIPKSEFSMWNKHYLDKLFRRGVPVKCQIDLFEFLLQLESEELFDYLFKHIRFQYISPSDLMCKVVPRSMISENQMRELTEALVSKLIFQTEINKIIEEKAIVIFDEVFHININGPLGSYNIKDAIHAQSPCKKLSLVFYPIYDTDKNSALFYRHELIFPASTCLRARFIFLNQNNSVYRVHKIETKGDFFKSDSNLVGYSQLRASSALEEYVYHGTLYIRLILTS